MALKKSSNDLIIYSHNLRILPKTGLGVVYIAYWKNTPAKHAIKKFNEILRKNEKNYSLVLEYADSGTLEKYLRDNVTTLIKWEIQLKFAREIAV
ncbi:hypothetical protein RhiirA4_486922 [Rhizophagus irregularis]|uniref:Protein kinase domain-containing protein n=1 Tax=Rhizophagus irregularis TaxID=588596 RepID=A0A2I1HS59_9GLOM|nr:hypothetical protein RhiirA4_486905 [Rhizophagus irregularis]PKY61650.1 hypothetical protein RhiirA4_486922 [Rhizophagus irregularis]